MNPESATAKTLNSKSPSPSGRGWGEGEAMPDALKNVFYK